MNESKKVYLKSEPALVYGYDRIHRELYQLTLQLRHIASNTFGQAQPLITKSAKLVEAAADRAYELKTGIQFVTDQIEFERSLEYTRIPTLVPKIGGTKYSKHFYYVEEDNVTKR
jgi:hypothetical protein